MQASVGALFILDMDGYLRTGFQVLAGRQLIVLEVGPQNVVGLAGRYALRKFPLVVGVEFPAGVFLAGGADFDLYAIHRVTVGVPHGAIDERVGLILDRFAGGPATGDEKYGKQGDEGEDRGREQRAMRWR